MKSLLLAAVAAGCGFAQSLGQAESGFLKSHPELDALQEQWESSAEAAAAPVDWTVTQGLVVQRHLAGGGRFNGKRVIDVDLEHEEKVRFGPRSRFSISVWISPLALTGALVARGKDAPHAAGYGLFLTDGRVQADLIHLWPDDAISVETEPAVQTNQWQNATMTYDGSATAAGIRIYLNGHALKLRVTANHLRGSFETSEELWIGGGNGPTTHFRGRMRAMRIYTRVLSPVEAEIVATDTPVNSIARIPAASRTNGQAQKIRLYFLERGAPESIRDAWQKTVEAGEN